MYTNPCIRIPAKSPAILAKPGQARLARLYAGLARKVWPGKASEGQAFMVTLATQTVLTLSFRLGFDPGLPRSGQAPDAREMYVKFSLRVSRFSLGGGWATHRLCKIMSFYVNSFHLLCKFM